MPSLACHHQDGDVHLGKVDLPMAQVEPPAGQLVDAEEAVVELAEGPPGIAVHPRHERVHRLDLGQEVAIVEIGDNRPRLEDLLVECGGLVGVPDHRCGPPSSR
ncbi:MAG: hypothetical protein ACJ76K_13690 [Solirubrobacteraceae bacterium]